MILESNMDCSLESEFDLHNYTTHTKEALSP